MPTSQHPPTWQMIRERADKLGIPAWKLAEELAFHESAEQLKFSDKTIKG